MIDVNTSGAGRFAQLVQEARDADVSGWDFSWLAGRATEQRPSWGYQRLLEAALPAPPEVETRDVDDLPERPDL